MFYFDNFYGKKVLKSSIVEDVEHFLTTKDFILSCGELKELEPYVEENKQFLCEKLVIPYENLITCKQTHSDNISIHRGEITHYDSCDAVILTIPETAAFLNFADCVPIILYDSKHNIAAIAHAGWRGTANKIAEKTIQKMYKELNCSIEDISAVIGPCIGKCCFETDFEVFNQLCAGENELFYVYNKETNKYYIDLKLLNKQQLLDNGVKNIDISSYCTSCNSDLFFSYRKEQGKTARHSAVVKLRKRD